MLLKEAAIFWNKSDINRMVTDLDNIIFITKIGKNIEKYKEYYDYSAVGVRSGAQSFSSQQSSIYILALALKLIVKYRIPYFVVHEHFQKIDEYKKETSLFE